VYDPSVLLVGSDVGLIAAIQKAFAAAGGVRLLVVSDLDAARVSLGSDPSVLLAIHLSRDIKAAQVGRFIHQLKSLHCTPPTVVLSDQFRPDQARKLRSAGVAEYLSKPLDLGRLVALADAELGRHGSESGETAPADNALRILGEESPFVYVQSPAMCEIMSQLKRVAPLPTTILLTGETGTGKTRLARLVHELSPRRPEPFFVVNCGALSVSLIESEMFGHVKGAFTGADRDHTGKLASAGIGTLLFDEIDALPIEWQAKLLRVVEERVFEPVGSNKSQAVQARFIAASNRDLEQEVAAGRFRSDLFHRLNVVNIRIPPLRDLRELIPPLVANFFAELTSRTGSTAVRVSEEVFQALYWYDWPGNVRELRNVIERAISLCADHEIRLDDLPLAIRCPAGQAVFPARYPASIAACARDRRVGDRRVTDRRMGDRRRVDRRADDRGLAAPRYYSVPAHQPAGAGRAAVDSGAPNRTANGHGGRPSQANGHMPNHLDPAPRNGTLPSRVLPPPGAVSKEASELSMLQQALERNNHNRLKTAAELGISRMTLYKKLRRYGLLAPGSRGPSPLGAAGPASPIDGTNQAL
jgi:DNA-binding NtrC family response regulator